MNRVAPVTSFSLRCTDAAWGFAANNRPAIERHWDQVVREKPTLWNGEILICTEAKLDAAHFSASLARSDYASFVAWRDWGRPDQSVCNCFGVAAAFSSDGALLMGVMGGWTLNAGKAYPPSGTLEPKDVRPDGSVDIEGNMRTELLEETGLDLAHARPGETVAIFEGPRLAIARRYDFDMSFAEMEKHFRAHAASDDHPELSAIEDCRSRSQIDSRMPGYAVEIVRYFLPS